MSRPASDAFTAIDALADLGRDWDSYDAEPVAPDAARRAKELLRAVVDNLGIEYGNPVVSATAEPGVLLMWRTQGDAKVEAFVSSEDARFMVLEKGQLIDHGRIVSPQSLVSVVRHYVTP